MKKTLSLFLLVFTFSLMSMGAKAQGGSTAINAGTVHQGSTICISLSPGERIVGTSITFSKDGNCVRLNEASNSGGRTVAIGEIVTTSKRYTVYAVVE